LGGDVNNPVASGDGIGLTSALETSLGLTSTDGGPFGILSTTHGTCTLGTLNCYNGIITVTNVLSDWYYRSGSQGSGTYDFFTAVEHETDEMLGTSSCITGVGTTGCNNGPPGTGISPSDLFRFVGGGSTTRSSSSSANGSVACLSINGGLTDIACYHNSPDGADYGDWDSTVLRVQNAFGTPNANGTDITNDGGSEIALLDAVGLNLNSSAIPEPATFGLLGVSLASLALMGTRRRKPRGSRL
jgi:hypothetical protein